MNTYEASLLVLIEVVFDNVDQVNEYSGIYSFNFLRELEHARSEGRVPW
jgi:hypothetical protein